MSSHYRETVEKSNVLTHLDAVLLILDELVDGGFVHGVYKPHKLISLQHHPGVGPHHTGKECRLIGTPL